MTEVRGMLSPEALRQHVEAEEIDTVVVAFTDHYGRQMGKRVDASFFVDQVAGEGSHACDYLLTVDMEMEPVPGYDYANWEKGYGDFHLVPDLSSLRVASWLDRTALVLCDVVDPRTHEPVAVAPRSVLRRQVDRAAEAGFEVMVGSELEYFLYRDSYQEAQAKGYADLQPFGWYIEDYHLLQATREEGLNGAFRRHLARSGVPVETTKGEWGRGQHELNVRYADAPTMADRHVIYKQCVKDVAEQMGHAVTFMAKPPTRSGVPGARPWRCASTSPPRRTARAWWLPPRSASAASTCCSTTPASCTATTVMPSTPTRPSGTSRWP